MSDYFRSEELRPTCIWKCLCVNVSVWNQIQDKTKTAEHEVSLHSARDSNTKNLEEKWKRNSNRKSQKMRKKKRNVLNIVRAIFLALFILQ